MRSGKPEVGGVGTIPDRGGLRLQEVDHRHVWALGWDAIVLFVWRRGYDARLDWLHGWADAQWVEYVGDRFFLLCVNKLLRVLGGGVQMNTYAIGHAALGPDRHGVLGLVEFVQMVKPPRREGPDTLALIEYVEGPLDHRGSITRERLVEAD